VRFVGAPAVIAPIARPEPAAAVEPPPRLGSDTAAPVPMLASPEPDAGAGPPLGLDASLVEATPAGQVPRVAPDGRSPLAHYRRPSSAADCSRPCVAVLVTRLGLVDKLADRALALPVAVGLSFSPYAGATAWQARAREAGHETLLGLPLLPERFPVDDEGPLALRPTAGAPAGSTGNGDALLRMLAAGGGYVAVDAAAGAFAGAPAAFAPVAAALRARGLGLIELGGDSLREPARAVGLPYLATAAPVDADPSPDAIDRALAAVAAEARRAGRAVAVAQPLPASLDRIGAWAATLPAQGMQLVPPSRLLLDGGGGGKAGAAAAVARRH
jgi:uncharacterized protein